MPILIGLFCASEIAGKPMAAKPAAPCSNLRREAWTAVFVIVLLMLSPSF
jgi:hypothetical protein